jgi:hypothetical protein
LALFSILKPSTSPVMLATRLPKKADSKSSLKAISWKAVKLLLAGFGGGAALDSVPSAFCWMVMSSCALGFGNPSVEGTAMRVSSFAGAAAESPAKAASAAVIVAKAYIVTV